MSTDRGPDWQLIWEDGKFVILTKKEVERRMKQVCKDVVEHIMDDIREPYPPASDPYTPPHRRTGHLHSSISFEVHDEGQEIAGYVGVMKKSPANLYGRALELGSTRTTDAGHTVTVLPRPYLRKGVLDMRAHIVRVLTA